MKTMEFADRVRAYLETPHPALVQLAEAVREVRESRPSWTPTALPEGSPTGVE